MSLPDQSISIAIVHVDAFQWFAIHNHLFETALSAHYMSKILENMIRNNCVQMVGGEDTPAILQRNCYTLSIWVLPLWAYQAPSSNHRRWWVSFHLNGLWFFVQVFHLFVDPVVGSEDILIRMIFQSVPSFYLALLLLVVWGRYPSFFSACFSPPPLSLVAQPHRSWQRSANPLFPKELALSPNLG